MQATLPLQETETNLTTTAPNSLASSVPDCVSVEIHSFLAARDLLFREADANTTDSNLRRACAANEFAESCLRPARSPYQAQSLPEEEAVRERQRCNAVRMRLAQLRVRAGRHCRAA